MCDSVYWYVQCSNGLDVVANTVFCQSQGCCYFYKQDIELCGHILQKKLASVCSLKDNESEIIPSSLYLNSLIMGGV